MFDLISELHQDKELSFNDKRLEKRYSIIDSNLELHQSCILNKISKTRAERKASYDFFTNRKVCEQVLMSRLYERLKAQEDHYKGTDLLVIGDTSEYNFSVNENRIKDKNQLGPLSNKYGLGYFVHASLALNAKDLSVLGLSDLQLWHRPCYRTDNEVYKKLCFEEKESYKWYVGVNNSHQRLSKAKHITYIQDRDGDVYESIIRIRKLDKADLLVRSCQNRRILSPNGEQSQLYDYLQELPVDFTYQIKIKKEARTKRKSRVATLEVRSARVRLLCPVHLNKKCPPQSWINIVWVREKGAKGEDAIDWKLITTHEVSGQIEELKKIIAWYKARWLIEEFFLSLRQGLMTWNMPFWNQDRVYEN